jgi:hypothetical protein
MIRKAAVRRYKRFVVERTDVYTKTLFATEVELLNMSMTGACITAKRSLKFAGKYLMRIEREGMVLSLPCIVAWENLWCSIRGSHGEIVPVYKAGVAFRNLSSDRLVRLKDFIRMFGYPKEQKLSDDYKPSALRFTMLNNEGAVLYYPKTSPVKKISLGGMLTEFYDGISVEQRFTMALFLPNDELPIKFKGRVASCIEMPDKRSKHFDIGIEFLGIAEQDKSRLSRFLNVLEEKAAPSR